MKRLCISLTTLLLLSLACNFGGVANLVATPTSAPAPTQPSGPRGRCGDGVCDGLENAGNCPADCAAPTEALTEPPSLPTPTRAAPEPQASPPADRCGDGVCDEFEQKDPQLCPQDCEDLPTTEPTSTVEEPALPTPTLATAPAAGVALASLPGGDLGVSGDPSTISQEGGAAGPGQQPNISFILDGSGSMNAELPGSGRTKLAVAKEVMTELVSQVPPEVNGALWIYGHRYPQEPKEQSCKDIEQVFPLGPVDAAAYTQAIQDITAIGYTPIADSMALAAENLPVGEDQVNSIILVSDGEETCGGDPCALAAALKQSDARVTIHVVGYDVDEVTREQLQCIANASGGMYRDASSAELLRNALLGALEAAQTDTILRLEVVGPNETQVGTRLLLYEAATDNIADFVSAWTDSAVAPGVYDIVIETTPPLLYSQVNIAEGSSTLIRLEVGAFEILGIGGEPANPYQVDVVDPASSERLGYLLDPGSDPYYVLPGLYNLALYPSIGQPSPEAVFSRVTINPLEAITLQLGALDLRGINNEEVRPHGITFYDAASGQEVAGFSGYTPKLYYLAPGTYRVELYFGISAYPGSTLNNVVINPGEINSITLGAYVLRDASGQPINPNHAVYDAASGEAVGSFYGYSPDRYYMPAGTYNIEVGDYNPVLVENVVIQAGQETVVPVPE